MDYEPGVLDALREVRALGQKDGFEHAIILKDGVRVWEGSGDQEHVKLPKEFLTDGAVVVHNHPASLNALSNVDILQVFHHGLKAMYAISADGSIYRASGRKLGVSPGEFMFQFEYAWAWLTAPAEVARVADRLGVAGDVSEAHWVNRLLAKQGLIRYDYDLQPETASIVNRMDEGIEFGQLLDDYLDAERSVERLVESICVSVTCKGERGTS